MKVRGIRRHPGGRAGIHLHRHVHRVGRFRGSRFGGYFIGEMQDEDVAGIQAQVGRLGCIAIDVAVARAPTRVAISAEAQIHFQHAGLASQILGFRDIATGSRTRTRFRGNIFGESGRMGCQHCQCKTEQNSRHSREGTHLRDGALELLLACEFLLTIGSHLGGDRDCASEDGARYRTSKLYSDRGGSLPAHLSKKPSVTTASRRRGSL